MVWKAVELNQSHLFNIRFCQSENVESALQWFFSENHHLAQCWRYCHEQKSGEPTGMLEILEFSA